MARLTISTTNDPDAQDSSNTVTINTVWNLLSANTWSYSSGAASIINNATGGTWENGGGVGIQFWDRNQNTVFGLWRDAGRTFPRGNSFGSLPVGTTGLAQDTSPDGTTWTIIAN